MSAIMEFRNVSFSHGARTIFDNLSFSVQQGETFALMGANGAGKTTLLRLVSALLRPSSGEIVVNGRELSQWNRKQLSCSVALVPQHLEVPFAYRVEEIVAQGRVPHLRFFGGLSSSDHEAIESAMEAVDILNMRRRIFTELSGGERQRVKIAIALAQTPRLMLLDEPTQHLDLGRQIELMALLRRLVDRGITIVAAMHDLALVREHCTSGILLSPNACATVGRVVDLLQPDRLKQAFSVDGAGLQRYLATQTPAEVTEDSSTPATAEIAVNPRRKIDLPRRAEGPRRKDEDIPSKRSRHNPSHSRTGRKWDAD
jgi:iron complex transport system ATP-binding protein